VRVLLALLLLAALVGSASSNAQPRAFDLQGHRGARGLAPENTLAAFRRALDIGVTTIETDVAVTKDGIPVISHDPHLNPDLVRDETGKWLAERGPSIHSLTLAELRRYDIGRTNPQSRLAQDFREQQQSDGERFPTLRDLLALVRDSGKPVRLAIETKLTPDNSGDTVDPQTYVRVIVDALREGDMAKRASILSFDWRTLVELRKAAPDIPTTCLTIESQGMNTVAPAADGTSPWHAGLSLRDHGSVPALAAAAGCSTWSVFWRNLTPAWLQEAHARRLTVLVWTVNNPADMERLIDMGVDGIITDYPDRLRRVMSAKGLPLP
jgi:glycerophosphoryl diester phosphodiesterase